MRTNLAPRALVRSYPASAAAVVLAAGAAWAAWLTGRGDSAQDLAIRAAGWPWPAVGALLLLPCLAIVHYVSAALALRDVSGRRMPTVQATLVQVASAATNRLIPNGLGGAGVNFRYLRRVGLAPGAATTALATLALVGGLTDAAFVAAITGIGPSVGLAGARSELSSLANRSLTAGHRHSWVVAAAVIGIAIVFVIRRRDRLVGEARSLVANAASHVRGLIARPRQIAGAAVASMATTAVLSVAFIVSVRTWAHGASPLPAGALIALYWTAVAAGGAVPLPAFFGVTEAALIAGLVLGGYSPTSATVAVLVFRLITFWLALPAGLWAGHRLRRARLL